MLLTERSFLFAYWISVPQRPWVKELSPVAVLEVVESLRSGTRWEEVRSGGMVFERALDLPFILTLSLLPCTTRWIGLLHCIISAVMDHGITGPKRQQQVTMIWNFWYSEAKCIFLLQNLTVSSFFSIIKSWLTYLRKGRRNRKEKYKKYARNLLRWWTYSLVF